MRLEDRVRRTEEPIARLRKIFKRDATRIDDWRVLKAV